MAYSIFELSSRDLDIFIQDKNKVIHIASGGGNLPNELLRSDIYNENLSLFYRQLNLTPEFDIEINPNLTEIAGLSEDQLENYLVDFISLAQKGLYTYDKTKLGNFEDFEFHLVAKPINPIPLYKVKDLKIYRNDLILPDSFTPFYLDEYVK